MKSRGKSQRRDTFKKRFAAFLVTLLFVGVGVAQPVFTVNSTVDAHDANPGDNICAAAGGACTLRAAIEESNASAGFPPEQINLPAGTYVLTEGRLVIMNSQTIAGAGAGVTNIDGNNSSGILTIDNPGTNPIVNVFDVTIRNGRGGIAFGTGIFVGPGSSLFLADCVVSDNESSVGGVGISNAGLLRLLRCTVRNNEVTGGGGGVTGAGGGIFNNRVSGQTTTPRVEIFESTISSNKAIRGGGIFNSGNLDITNSTISGNMASVGGGIRNVGGVVNIAYCTITDNTAGIVSGEPSQNRVGGGLANILNGQINMGNSVLAGNRDGRVKSDPLYSPDCFSTEAFRFTSFRGNLLGIMNENCEFRDAIFGDTRFDQVGTPEAPLDPQLDPLANNGGPTKTHKLRSSSPAIDQGTGVTSATFFDCPVTDQRGVVRPQAVACDVGALEDDRIPPSCSCCQIIPGPPKQVQVTVRDNGGLASVSPVTLVNASLSVLPFSVGTTAPVVIMATKTNQSQPSSVTIRATDVAGNFVICDPVYTTVSSEPTAFTLEQNFPNPFNPETNIKFSVETPGRATLEVFDILGQKVATLFDAIAESGQYYELKFDATALSSGSYYYRLQSGARSEFKKLLLFK
jgi:CSLREA domain-containing protein